MRVKTILYSSHFLRAFKKLPKYLKPEIEEREALFRADCFDPRFKTHKLHGALQDFWSFSISTSYRILFSLEKDGAVTFVDTGDHSVYG